MKTRGTGRGLLAILVFGGLIFFARLFGCSGAGLFGVGGGGDSGGGAGTGKPSAVQKLDDQPKAVESTSKLTRERLGIEVTKDAVQVNVYVLDESLELEGQAITPEALGQRLDALRKEHSEKKLTVVAQTSEATRMKGLHELRNVARGRAEFSGPDEAPR